MRRLRCFSYLSCWLHLTRVVPCAEGAFNTTVQSQILEIWCSFMLQSHLLLCENSAQHGEHFRFSFRPSGARAPTVWSAEKHRRGGKNALVRPLFVLGHLQSSKPCKFGSKYHIWHQWHLCQDQIESCLTKQQRYQHQPHHIQLFLVGVATWDETPRQRSPGKGRKRPRLHSWPQWCIYYVLCQRRHSWNSGM